MTDSEDDEISIDFSKVGGFLKKLTSEDEEKPKAKKKKEKPAAKDFPEPKAKKRYTSPPEEEAGEEIGIDFSAIGSKLKGMFKQEGKEKPSREKGDEEELSIDFRGMATFLTNYKHVLVPTALVLIALFLSIYLRMQPASLPIAEDWGRNQIYNVIRNDIASAVYAQNPTLPQEHKDRIVADQFSKAVKEPAYTFKTGQYAGQAFDINQQAGASSQQLKNFFKDDKGVTYLNDIDTWYHYRTVRNRVEKGQFYDELKEGVPWDNHMLAPLGRNMKMEIGLHHYVGYYLHKAISLFRPGISLMVTFALVQVIVSALAVIPAFFITRRLGGNLGGFFAAALVAIHPVFLTRTFAGISDTDAYNVTLPLFVTWAFLEAFEAENLRKKVCLTLIAGFLVGITSFAWIGWWYIFDFLLATIGIFMASEVARIWLSKKRLEVKDIISRLRDPVILILVFFLVSSVFVVAFTNVRNFKRFYTEPLPFTQKKEVALTKIWPNVYTTVAELNPASLNDVRSAISFGKPIYFYLSIIGILLTMVRLGKGKIDIKYATLLTIWFMSTAYASLKGVRFIMLLVPAFGIALGVFAGVSSRVASGWLSKQFNFSRKMAQLALAAVLLLLLLVPFKSGMAQAKQTAPIMNDDWYNALTRIRTESAQDAIINSWWDFGHWFKAIADRRVTFDGTSQNTPMAHWIGRVLLTENEDEAMGILRMLDCGSNRAFETLNGYINDEVKSVETLYEIITLDHEGARARLEEIISPEQAENVLKYMHCDPPEDYFITSDDMVGKSGVWGHFGSWDMRRAAMYNRVRGKDMQEGTSILKEDFGLSESEATRIYYEVQTEDADTWIAPWPSYWASGPCATEGNMVRCQSAHIAFTLDRTTGKTEVPTQQGQKRFSSVAFIDSNRTFRAVKATENVLENAGVRFGAAVYGFPEPNQFIITSARIDGPQQGNDWLPGSMFSRLFFFNGYGLEHFDLFDARTGNTRIFTWKVDWEGNLKSSVSKGDMLWVNYLGWFGNGTLFDSSIIGWENMTFPAGMAAFEEYETRPMPYIKGSGTVIPGFENALEGMAEGEVKDVEIPPEKGYGTDPALHPLANQTLHFKLQVVKIG